MILALSGPTILGYEVRLTLNTDTSSGEQNSTRIVFDTKTRPRLYFPKSLCESSLLT
jgi:hypothetical protein